MYRTVLTLAALLGLQSAIAVAQPIPITPVRLVPSNAVVSADGGAYRFIANPQDPTVYRVNTPFAALDLRGATVEVIADSAYCTGAGQYLVAGDVPPDQQRCCERIRLIRGTVR